MSKCIVIIGAGQLGRRYLQGLMEISTSLKIEIFDPDPISRELALSVVNDLNSVHEIRILDKANLMCSDIDLAIISTQSQHRLSAVKNLNGSRVQYLILEKLLASNTSDLDELSKNLKESDKVWVNTPRRVSTLYSSLKSHMYPYSKLKINVTGGSWGLASNSIHFFDLLSYFSNDNLNKYCCEIDSDSKWVKSARKGIYELIGSMKLSIGENFFAELESATGNDPIQITIETDNGLYVVDESMGKVTQDSKSYLDLERLPYQSEITPRLVNQILSTGECGLPKYALSHSQHEIVLSALQSHWITSKGNSGNPAIT